MTDDDQETLPGHQHLRQSLPGPPGRPAGKVLTWRRDTDSAADDYEDLMVWRVPISLAHRFRGAAGARGLTLAQYLSGLIIPARDDAPAGRKRGRASSRPA